MGCTVIQLEEIILVKKKKAKNVVENKKQGKL
jgi:hypothetical protein